MCGISGFLDRGGLQPDSFRETAAKMIKNLVHRGPDDGGIWVDDVAGVALAHRRLSILDVSPAGHQPMESLSGRYVIVFNGEVYNHLKLRAELEKGSLNSSASISWRGHSDTETLLAGFDTWGIKKTIERCIGMFAFALWDKVEQVLTLGRDRLGEKPLYYGWQPRGGTTSFLFGSELSALKANPAFSADIDRDALCLMMRYCYVPEPYSIFRNIFKLPPGHLLTVSLARQEPVLTQYWSVAQIARQGVASPFIGTDVEAIDALEALLKDAVSQQMVADVPLGAFLSGGIDSSTVVALMQVQSTRPVKTFTIGFNEHAYNEAVHAKAVARYLGTEHTELYVTPQQALNVIPHLPQLYNEPFSDSSQIPTFLVSQLAGQHVTVALSGDAGDELFAGYNRYVQGHNRWGYVSRIPFAIRKLGAKALLALSPNHWNALLNPFHTALPASMRMSNLGEKLHKIANVLPAQTINDLYLSLLSHWEPSELVVGGSEPLTVLRGLSPMLEGLDDVQHMMALDTMTYLADDILVKTDRATMGASLEGRVPFLDHRVVEFAWKLPSHMKLRDGIGKWALRQVLYRHVPKELIERPKMGFGVPIDVWLRGPLRDWAEALLSEFNLKSSGFFNPAPIRKKWSEHLSGEKNWQFHLWDVLMFQAWLEAQGSRSN